MSTTFQDLIDDGVLDIGDGYRAKHSELGGGGPIFLRAVHLQDNGFDFEGVDYFSQSLIEHVSCKMAAPGDVVVTTKGNSTGRTGFVRAWMPEFVYSPHLSFWRSIDSEVLDAGFLRQWARGPEFLSQLEALKAQTDMAPYLSLRDQRRLRISLPPIGEQRAIARLLGALDDKIELNREMNRTLEATAQAIFRSWFVDFDPVVAKADGRKPFGMADDLAALFPDRFVESELGPIPEGWEVGSIYDSAEVLYGAPFKSRLFNESREGRPLIRIRDLRTHQPAVWTTESHKNEREVAPGDIIVGMDGEFSVQMWHGPRALLNQRVCLFEPRSGCPQTFVRLALEGPMRFFERTKTGTTVIHLGKRDIDTIQFVLPTEKILSALGDLTDPVMQQVLVNERESQTLAALRDLLLPKLLSGEIRVAEAEERLEAAGA